MRTALSWVVMQRVVLIPYRHLRTLLLPSLWVKIWLWNNPAEHSSHILIYLWTYWLTVHHHVSHLTSGWVGWWENYLCIFCGLMSWDVAVRGTTLMCIYICSGTVGCGLQRWWTARYIGSGGMTKYASSEDMEQIDWIWIFFFFFEYTILLPWKLRNIFMFSFRPFPPTPSSYS